MIENPSRANSGRYLSSAHTLVIRGDRAVSPRAAVVVVSSVRNRDPQTGAVPRRGRPAMVTATALNGGRGRAS